MRYVIIGNSAAGIGAVEGIRQVDGQGVITIITSEREHTYSRPLISYLLQGKTDEDKMRYRPAHFYDDNNCTLVYGTVIQILPNEKQVALEDGSKIPYDKLLVASGSSAFTPPIEGLDTVKSKHHFMTLNDARNLKNAIARDSRVLIVGAGLIGLKCAEGILNKVGSVTVVDLAPRILSAILDEESAAIVQKHLENQGIEFKLESKAEDFGNYDIVVIAAGVRPNTALLNGIADINRGIIVNEKSETSHPDIYAAGDCTESIDKASGQRKIMALLPNAYMQGEAAGINMAGGDKACDKLIPMNAVGLCGLHIITAGNYTGEVLCKDNNRFFISDNKLNGYILIDNIEKAGVYTRLVREKRALEDVTEIIREALRA
ncbi:MAG: FAD-dependent oxidoreductase [Oscillospiraceae bacterium]|nr:FAD-dependent oxidoreductase [Oscillospiraceae bacterium]